jgi:hypothetical protein
MDKSIEQHELAVEIALEDRFKVEFDGKTVYRGWVTGVEAFSVSNPSSPVRLSSIPATLANAGVGLTSD